ncbi:MAG: xanthine dehydrogenase accessory protein XdhC [Litoreibacter sp.]
MTLDLQTLRRAIETHGTVARVVVADVKGSVPREVGASMLVWEGGQSGTIGGGALEFDAASRALSRPGIYPVPLGPALGQCCGGHVTLVNEIFDQHSCLPNGDTWARQISGSREKPLSIVRHEREIRSGKQRSSLLDQGWWLEPTSPTATPLWIYGAGHVGRALVKVLAPLPDWAITWVDTGPERFPPLDDTVQVLPAVNPADTVKLAPQNASHLIVTYSHALDLELCHRILGQGFDFAGLIGSSTKWARFQIRLRALGHSNAQITRITCPIGDSSLGKHPQAIAVGVASSLLSRRNRVVSGSGQDFRCEEDHAL